MRNPNWKPEGDIRPACLDEIDVKIGGNASMLGRQALEGTDTVLESPPAQSSVREAAERFKEQLEISPGAGDHYIALNNKVGPFKSEDLRKAVWAALDRTAMDKARAGALVTNVATHFIYPGIPGYEQAGGAAGTKVNFNEHPEGDKAVAEEYIKKAGYPNPSVTFNGKFIPSTGNVNQGQVDNSEIQLAAGA